MPWNTYSVRVPLRARLASCLDASIVVTLDEIDAEGDIVASKVIAEECVRDVISREILEETASDGAKSLFEDTLINEIDHYAAAAVGREGYQRAPDSSVEWDSDGYSVVDLEETPFPRWCYKV